MCTDLCAINFHQHNHELDHIGSLRQKRKKKKKNKSENSRHFGRFVNDDIDYFTINHIFFIHSIWFQAVLYYQHGHLTLLLSCCFPIFALYTLKRWKIRSVFLRRLLNELSEWLIQAKFNWTQYTSGESSQLILITNHYCQGFARNWTMKSNSTAHLGVQIKYNFSCFINVHMK